jgi:hypothetical protein
MIGRLAGDVETIPDEIHDRSQMPAEKPHVSIGSVDS